MPTQAELNLIIENFIDERKLRLVPNADIVGETVIFDYKRNVLIKPYITPVVEFDPVTRTIPTQYENGRKAVSHKDAVDFIEPVIVDNADGVYAVAVGEQKQIVQIYTDLNTIAGGANKDFTVTIVKGIAGAALVDAMVTGAIVVVPATDASIAMFRSGPTWLNNAGVIANEDTNVTGIILQEGDTITATWTNKVADDRVRLQVGEINLPVI